MVKVLALLPQFPIARRSDLNDNVPEPAPPVQLRVVTLCGSCKYLDGEVSVEVKDGGVPPINCRLKAKPLQPKKRCDLFIEALPEKVKTKKPKARKNKKKKLQTKKKGKKVALV